MTISPDPDQIRTIVFRTFLELDVDEERLSDLDERIMLDAGRYVARSYRVDDFLAMWMIEIGLLLVAAALATSGVLSAPWWSP